MIRKLTPYEVLSIELSAVWWDGRKRGVVLRKIRRLREKERKAS
jgi:hypothetical protein